MGAVSIWHWLVVLIVVVVPPILGIVRGVKNGSVGHTIVSAFVPIYGLIYFLVASKKKAIAS